LINSRQAKELESASVLARLTVALKTDDILVTIYSKERPESTIEVKFKNREQEVIKFMYPVKENVNGTAGPVLFPVTLVVAVGLSKVV